MEKQLSIIEQIHSEFDTAVDKLVSYSGEIKKTAEQIAFNSIRNEEISSKLSELGFSNAKDVIEYTSVKGENDVSFSKKRELNDRAEAIVSFIKSFIMISPGYKVILYSQVINICEKYNLMLAPASIYQGEIPVKNQKDIINFPLNSIENKVKEYDFKLHENKGPLCSFGRTSKFYMAAPLDEFNLKDTSIIGNEIYSIKDQKPKFKWEMPKPKPRDPIVLYPIHVRLLKQVGFIIVTAWGAEASDPMILNESHN